MEGGGWKRIALGGNKESLCGQKTFYLWKREIFADSEKTLVQKKFLCVRKRLWVKFVKFSANEIFCFAIKAFFRLMQSRPIKKSIFQHTKTSISHRTKANEQLQILSAITYCELAVKQLFSKKYRSCVSTAVTLSHRFKAFTPAFCRQNRFRQKPSENSA